MLSPRATLATPYRRAVTGLVVVTLLWRAWTVARWTWQDDDWLFIERSASMPLLTYLTQDYNSHVMPGGLLVTKLMVEISPLNFWLAVTMVSATCAASVALWGMAFERLTGGRLVALLPLAVIALSPVMLRPMMWWASAVTALPLQVSLAVMVLLACAYVEHHRRRDLVLLGVAFGVGLFFWEKSVFTTIPTAFVLVAVAEGGVRQRLRTVARPCGLLAAIAVPYLALFLFWTRGASSSNSVETSFAGQTLSSATFDYARGLGQMFFPAVLGGPWGTMQVDGYPYSTQPVLWTVLVLVVLAAGVAWLAVRHRRALWLLTLPLTYVVITVGLVLFSSRLDEVWDVVLVDRYYIDGVVVAMLTVVLVLRTVGNDPDRPGTPTRPGRLLVVAAAALAASLVAGNALAAERVGVRPARDWVKNLRHELATATPSPTAEDPLVLWDSYAPENVMPWAFWADHGLLSRMLSPYRPDVQFHVPTDNLYLVSDTGRLEPVDVDPAVSAQPGPVAGCGYAIGAGEEVAVPMTGALYSWNWALQVNGFASEGVDLVVALGEQELIVSMPPGLQSRKIQFEGELPQTVVLRSESATGTACVSELFAGPVGARSPS